MRVNSNQLVTMGKGKRIKTSSGLSPDKTVRLVKLVLKNKSKVN
jgi:hypothetical protein